MQLLRLPAVLALRGRKRASHYGDIKAELMTPGVSIGPNAKAWPDTEIEAINAARVAGKSDDEIRELVKRLKEERKTAFAKWEAARET